jgi:diadenosine tetraphosphatase ApaH/serine/threonine PP2A family protein phosphatase
MLTLWSESGCLGCWRKLGDGALAGRAACSLYVFFLHHLLLHLYRSLADMYKHLCSIMYLKSWFGAIAVRLSFHRLAPFSPATRAGGGTAGLSKVSVDVLITCSSRSCRLTRAWWQWYVPILSVPREGKLGLAVRESSPSNGPQRDVSRW